MSSIKQARDLDADLALCEGASGVTLHDFNAIGRLVQFAREAATGWTAAIQRAQEAEEEKDKLREENALLQEQLQQHHRSHCFD